jgi:hypothetical protein
MSAFLRKYGVAATVRGVPLITRSSADFLGGTTFAAGDVTLSIDGGGLGNIGTLPSESTAGSKLFTFTFTSAEMAGAQIAVNVVDLTTTKVFEDQRFLIETYGHPSGQHAFDLDPLCGTVTASTANTASLFKTDLSVVTADYYNGCLVTFVDGGLSGQVKKITDYSTAAEISISTDAFTAVPTTGAAFRIISQ